MFERDEKKMKRDGKLLSACAVSLAFVFLNAVSARAQNVGDITSSAGVFIKPARSKTRVQPSGNNVASRNSTSHHAPVKTNTPPPNTHTPKAPTAESLNAKAGALIDAKNFADAVDPLRQAIKLKPDFADAQYNLGFALYSLDKYADAVGPLQRATQLDARDADAFYYLGASLAKLNRHAEAAAEYEQASRLDPKDEKSLEALGGEYAAAGDTDHAI